jgi:hypothetical protein
VLEKLVTRVVRESVGRIYREPLARRTAHKNIELSLAEPKPLRDFGSVYVLDWPANDLSRRMIQLEGIYRQWVEVIRKQAMKAGLTEAFRDASSSGKKVNCG